MSDNANTPGTQPMPTPKQKLAALRETARLALSQCDEARTAYKSEPASIAQHALFWLEFHLTEFISDTDKL